MLRLPSSFSAYHHVLSFPRVFFRPHYTSTPLSHFTSRTPCRDSAIARWIHRRRGRVLALAIVRRERNARARGGWGSQAVGVGANGRGHPRRTSSVRHAERVDSCPARRKGVAVPLVAGAGARDHCWRDFVMSETVWFFA